MERKTIQQTIVEDLQFKKSIKLHGECSLTQRKETKEVVLEGHGSSGSLLKCIKECKAKCEFIGADFEGNLVKYAAA